jgi:hypothetical protein
MAMRFSVLAMVLALAVGCGGGGGDDDDDDDDDGGSSSGLTCGEIFECSAECETDACAEECYEDGSRSGQEAADDVIQCIVDNQCEDEACLEEECGGEIQACFE